MKGADVNLNTDALTPQYRSKTERRFADMAMAECYAQFGVYPLAIRYEPMTFAIPGGRYTPDFELILPDRDVFVEVKGSKRQKNYRDARSKLRAAAETYPERCWYEYRMDTQEWEAM